MISRDTLFTPLTHLFLRPFSPPWRICSWLSFAATWNVSLSWLRERYQLAALFGGVGGPLAYCGGARLGATETLPTLYGLLALARGWGGMKSILAWLAQHFRRTP